ncbi:NAD-dependent epimerase/dehydratase family protein [Vibrio cholerae]|uniref:NAD-dependent epimerase/dehydratase family protein n=1 Tax=Vibrio cholerae TaxID=666 RepID=UPI000851E70C|nr:NAD-dependent epimerase/dehydratase family protein [Vibrio cholerae]EGR5155557.1 NAD-dependent epimerase/dehydratase family protein [Vibrio cholerae]EIC9845364.1 NAD-dependent epimerase/dehydratase family protein [Vibrio cholerae]EJL6300088.1 NAD-dependent epimerase/dehydratase family protein [Vibrio cholerae]EJL6478104.1 NAD-dependent epimerase/dehydratase family protein [Vibrio cholerae]EJL6880548.1 NAD-dependent epimerase/dehydratase family protein [Vibrio cholerae]
MKVLIAGASGYIGRHVTSLFRESQFEVFVYSRNHMAIPKVGVITSDSSKFNNYFDVVINCARPHWSEYSPNEIAAIEQQLLEQLDQFAAVGAVKIHTSGVWLFGHSSPDELAGFVLKPLDAVKLDVHTIQLALDKDWHVVYCPSLVYGGENCQLKRVIESLSGNILNVAVPSVGLNQYIHVTDIARYYLLLVRERVTQKQHFIAEAKGFSPEEFSQLLLSNNIVQKVTAICWDEFESLNGRDATEVEKLNLLLPVCSRFKPTQSVESYVKNYT